MPRRGGRKYERERRKGLLYSAVMHLLFLAMALIGLPSFLLPEPPQEPAAISVEILPVSAISNIKPAEPEPEKKAEEEKKKEEPKKPSPPTKSEETAPPPPPELKAEEKKKKEEPKKEEKQKEEPKKEDKKKDKPKEDPFAVLMDKLKKEKAKEKTTEKTETKPEESKPERAESSRYTDALPLSMSEKDAIMAQIDACWNRSTSAGSKDAENLIVYIDAEYTIDGNYVKAVISPKSLPRTKTDLFYLTAAEAALRAVKQCSPLKNLPMDKFDSWRQMELRFDPSARNQ